MCTHVKEKLLFMVIFEPRPPLLVHLAGVDQSEYSRTVETEKGSDWLPGNPQKVLLSPGPSLSRTHSVAPYLRLH